MATRKKLFAANWKMNLDPSSARALIRSLRAELDADLQRLDAEREAMVAPPAILIPAVASELEGSAIALGAQNMYCEDKGAFTGEISPPMLLAFATRYVILGHSERRHIFGEDDQLIARKLKAALAHGLTPLLCVGETLAQRDAGATTEVITTQLLAGIDGLSAEQVAQLVIAYEPLWAIGTGRTASAQQAQEAHGALRGALDEQAGREAGRAVRILYGGSVTPENIDSLASKPDIDGALVGGTSLKADSFARIVRANLS